MVCGVSQQPKSKVCSTVVGVLVELVVVVEVILVTGSTLLCFIIDDIFDILLLIVFTYLFISEYSGSF